MSFRRWAELIQARKEVRLMFDTVVAVVLWLTWRFRNNAIFGTVKLRKDEIFDDILLLARVLGYNLTKPSKITSIDMEIFLSPIMSIESQGLQAHTAIDLEPDFGLRSKFSHIPLIIADMITCRKFLPPFTTFFEYIKAVFDVLAEKLAVEKLAND
ncbi:hypothetical protein LXL04_006457 [Taraxacum kok-saghyz]